MRNGQNNNKRMRNRNNHNNNNNRRGQNPMTRVYDSNGPDVKIRGTAAHIAEKYLQLARDSQSAGDPVAAENYYQHAEHYFRLIATAQEQFRQNQPQPQQQQQRADGDLRDGDEDEESFSNFGAEPGFGVREPQPSYQAREPQPSYQPREHRDRDPGLREQPREQNLREGRSQPVHQDSDADNVDRLPSFITGAQPQPTNGANGYEGNGHQGGDRFPPRRRRRPHGPRGEGRTPAQPSLSEDFSSGE
ncbi:DUF4167 domain-containing protein [Bradyrhizobium sp. U87765 SZCCT0131]|uniref:DUF4167 domain-containing protein n=1 Tax=unclassified Bradyrhizobium TaxID=2631580 RepID=UPI001BABCEC4|nr:MULTISPECIES: DUF4167 domain-containing protein [unclassified Bradyrhizobium]MBR1217106.1 DUF4167 domain-containing protein [Bradyrhizobium sp. U87765 SZCCT0131]MBR1259138.1 DUF4167 domain-containing protein [Bradyrhizobium sp. U87765 SZCCT0134]MBR1305279.1 DUF4167 domain-containing protein [Bradyrhizobium sp. U87765 SZCCT0110]MBR1321065.1 DUF4167 domain-containing protein [Bradyrhizobium sp. U87765 SZCCT0109]MBR1350281.1 DUF4167 domain-containing protein [Bradyrhizobium sp. U87765 SZCCT004